MFSLREGFQKTRYEDINKLLLETHLLLKETEELRKEIKKELEFNPEEDLVYYEGYLWKKIRI
jgi:hypothetical protein